MSSPLTAGSRENAGSAGACDAAFSPGGADAAGLRPRVHHQGPGPPVESRGSGADRNQQDVKNISLPIEKGSEHQVFLALFPTPHNKGTNLWK